MSEVAELLRTAQEITTGYREQRSRPSEKPWDALVVTAEGLHNLLQQHEAAIRAVTSPVVYDRDLAATSRRYRELLRGVTVFSSAYEDAQGVLSSARHLKRFDQGSGRNWVDLVCHRLGEFQWAAFSLHWSSGEMDNLLLEADKLYELLSETTPDGEPSELVTQQKAYVQQAFVTQAFPSLLPKRFGLGGEEMEAATLETREDVIDLVRRWCEAWSDRITQLLYQGGQCGICGDTRHEPSRYGLYRILGQLKATRFESDSEHTKENHDMVTILFLAADPTNASRLRLGEEFREIQEKLRLARLRDQFSLALPQLSVRPVDISQALLDVQPQIVHFSGHGTATGALCFEDQVGRIQSVEPDALAALFEQFADQVDCVLLNACYSAIQANAIAKHINYVIGMNRAIGDPAAIAFAIGFYQALGAGRSVEDAYKLGCVQIRLQGIPEHLTPVLHRREPRKPQAAASHDAGEDGSSETG